MDMKEWLKLGTLVAGVVVVGLGLTVGAAQSGLLVPLGVGLITSVAVPSTGVLKKKEEP